MNVKVEVELSCSSKDKHKKQMYNAAQSLTDDKRSIQISFPPNAPKTVIAEFTIKKARQIDVVDQIAREFSYCLPDYDTSSISFPAPTRKSGRAKPVSKKTIEKETVTENQGQYLVFIHEFIKAHGYSPDVMDFIKYFHVGSTSVYRTLARLEEKGFMKRLPQKPRSVDLLISEEELLSIKNSVTVRKGRKSLADRFNSFSIFHKK